VIDESIADWRRAAFGPDPSNSAGAVVERRSNSDVSLTLFIATPSRALRLRCRSRRERVDRHHEERQARDLGR